MARYFGTYSTHQRDHHLTVGVGLEFISGAASSSQLDMIVNLTVHGKNELPIVAHDGLCAGVCAQYPFVRDDNFFFCVQNMLTDTDDRKTLMDQYAALTNVAAGPVRTTMTLLLRESDEFRSVGSWFLEVVHSEYATHSEDGRLGDVCCTKISLK